MPDSFLFDTKWNCLEPSPCPLPGLGEGFLPASVGHSRACYTMDFSLLSFRREGEDWGEGAHIQTLSIISPSEIKNITNNHIFYTWVYLISVLKIEVSLEKSAEFWWFKVLQIDEGLSN